MKTYKITVFGRANEEETTMNENEETTVEQAEWMVAYFKQEVDRLNWNHRATMAFVGAKTALKHWQRALRDAKERQEKQQRFHVDKVCE